MSLCAGKSVKIILSPEAKEAYKHLIFESQNSKVEHSILTALDKKFELVKSNPHYGYPISKNILVHTEYPVESGVNNLFRVELPNYWRMLYTLKNDESETNITCVVLDVIDHKEYNKMFGYRSK